MKVLEEHGAAGKQICKLFYKYYSKKLMNINTAGFLKTVSSVYNLLMNTIFPWINRELREPFQETQARSTPKYFLLLHLHLHWDVKILLAILLNAAIHLWTLQPMTDEKGQDLLTNESVKALTISVVRKYFYLQFSRCTKYNVILNSVPGAGSWGSYWVYTGLRGAA